MLLANQKLSDTPLLSGDEEGLRAQRTWFLVNVIFLTWAFFAVYLSIRGHESASRACIVQASVYLLIRVFLRKSQQYKMIINLYLAASGFGLFYVAASDPQLKNAMFFFPISILVCSYLFGIRQASLWFSISLIHFTTYFYFEYGITSTFVNHIDELVLSYGISFCTFFCCQQAEASYKSQSRRMVDFSNALKKRSDELELLATTDSLTGLTNRFQFQNELESLVKVATDESQVALFLVDMDGFKEINDTLGHATGDEVLVEIGNRLLCEMGGRASVARLGGDEFCLLFSGVANSQQANEIAGELVTLLTNRYVLSDIAVTLGTSVGYALCPDHAQTGKHILSFADTAMYHAKHNKINIACYQSEMTDRLSSNRLMNEQLADALERDEFYLVYQPQIDSKLGQVIGAEALMRWEHDGKTIPPTIFIPLLESRGRIVSVSKWLVRQACQQQAQWKQQGLDIPISINVSALQFADDDFVGSLIRPMEEFDVCPSKLEIEITEGILIDNVDKVIQKLEQLKKYGCQISIDDFGTGYSSLAYLRQFPLDKLKIDRAFVKGIPDSDDGVIASGIIILADLLNLDVIAEGVETEEQVDYLKENGCHQFQGYYFSRPVAPEEVVALARSCFDVTSVSPLSRQLRKTSARIEISSSE